MKRSSCFVGVFLALVSVCCRVESKCNKGCDVALASYYTWAGTNLTFISQALDAQVSDVVRYNRGLIPYQDSVQAGIRINIPFSCQCIGGSFLGHIFNYKVKAGDTYTTVAKLYYSNLTTASWLQSFNSYDPNQIPDTATLNVTVNCSCGNDAVSKDFDLFITYPLRPEDSLESIFREQSVATYLLESYNPEVNFSRGSGLVYIPRIDRPPPLTPPSARASKGPRWKKQIGVIFTVIPLLISLLVYTTAIWCFKFRNGGVLTWKTLLFMKSEHNLDAEIFFKINSSLILTRYKYGDVKKITNSFSEKLGQGGFGAVYKGKLRDDCLVAVKILINSKTSAEEFVNEVVSISKTSHINVISLLGFCYEGNKRALIFEYMPNGSLDKFISSRQGLNNMSTSLDYKTLYKIALGIARGLEYLHQGCNTRILHFDIKPQNILLDANFTPKISDFGLAKLCRGRESALSILGMRGTVGFIAPELVCKNLGRVSHKSDVYSYGMLMLEIVGLKNSSEIEASTSSAMYFPEWIYRKFEYDNELRLPNITTEEELDTLLVRKMIIVSLWCIQTNPSDRPSISKVIEMLEDRVELLQMPPRPVLYSPTRPSSQNCEVTVTKSKDSSGQAGEEGFLESRGE